MLWFLSIFLSVICIFMTYYMAYKKKDEFMEPGYFIVMLVMESLLVGLAWGLAILMQNRGNVNLNASADSELMAAFAPYITSAIIHFAILFPAYYVYKNDDAKNKNDNNVTISPHPAVKDDSNEDGTFYVNGEKLTSCEQFASYRKFDNTKSFAENVRSLMQTTQMMNELEDAIKEHKITRIVYLNEPCNNQLLYDIIKNKRCHWGVTEGMQVVYSAEMFTAGTITNLQKCADILSDRCIAVIMNECAKQRVRFRDGFMNAIRELIGDCGEDRETLINTIADYCRKLIMKNGER